MPAKRPVDYYRQGDNTMDYTLYVDESGVFEGRREFLGLRIVAGVLLDGTPDLHREPIHSRLDSGFGWYRPPWHATEINPLAVAVRLRHSQPDDLPAHLRSLRGDLRGRAIPALRADAPELYDAVARTAQDVRSRACLSASATLREFRGQILICAEHGLALWPSRYPVMLACTVQAALCRLFEDGRTGARLHVLVEDRTDKRPPRPDDLDRAMRTAWARLRPGSVAPALAGPIEFHAKGVHPGLVLADIVAYQLGPRYQGNRAWWPRDCMDWNLRPVRKRPKYLGAPAYAVDAINVLPAFGEVLFGTRTAAETRSRMIGQIGNLPDGVLNAPVECACEILRAWEGMGL